MLRRVPWLCNRSHPTASPGYQRPGALRAVRVLNTRLRAEKRHARAFRCRNGSPPDARRSWRALRRVKPQKLCS
jgi:hypothetical protein